MKYFKRFCVVGPLGILAACATPPPTLLFADSVTFGLQLGTNSASGGGGVTIGYKNRSVAIVPMSVLNEDGKAQKISGTNGKGNDVVSAFAVFEASDPDRITPLRVGQMFSTGIAAQHLTSGYECRLTPGHCASLTPESLAASAPAATAAASAAIASAAVAASAALTAAAAASAALESQSRAATAALSAKASTPSSNHNSSDNSSDRPYQLPLVYARTDVIGIDISGSAAEQGAVFTLGYTGRNLALVPVYTPSAGLQVTGLFGAGVAEKDASSVLGQFNASTKTNELNFGLQRYFATGIAAQNLSRGIKAAVAASAASASN